ncbi:MAG: RNA polymerase sigma factor SigF [Prochlorotrichaceae cyanobacterium]
MAKVPLTDTVKRDSIELLRQYQHTPTARLRNQLVQLNLGLVRREVRRWLQQTQESYDDLMQVGSIGLIRAVERFEISKGNAFSSFAIPYIRGEIQHYLRDKSTIVRIPRRWLTLRQQGATLAQEWQARTGNMPSDLDISEALGITLAEWQEVKLASQNRSLLSLDAPVSQQAEEELTALGDILPDAHYRSFQLAQEDQIRLQQALNCLEEKTRHILEFVFLHDLTQRETAERLGLSTVTVSRRVKKGLKALKTLLHNGE